MEELPGKERLTKKSLFTNGFPYADYSKITFPPTPPTDLGLLVADAGEEARDLFLRFLLYDGARRVAAREALMHKYFQVDPQPARWGGN